MRGGKQPVRSSVPRVRISAKRTSRAARVDQVVLRSRVRSDQYSMSTFQQGMWAVHGHVLTNLPHHHSAQMSGDDVVGLRRYGSGIVVAHPFPRGRAVGVHGTEGPPDQQLVRPETGVQQPQGNSIGADAFQAAQVICLRPGAIERLIESMTTRQRRHSSVGHKVRWKAKKNPNGRHTPESQIIDRLVVADVIETREQGLMPLGDN